MTGPGVLANDTDGENDALTAAVVTGPAHGSLTLNPNGSFNYTPNANYNGSDSFTYKANDGTVDSAGTATVSLTVNAVNDAPVNTVPGAKAVAEDTALVITGLSVADVDSGGAAVTTTLSVLHGTLNVASAGGATVTGSGTSTVTLVGTVAEVRTTLQASSNIVYQGVQNFAGADTLTMVTNDGGNTGNGGIKTDTDTVAITVSAVNDAPVNAVPAAQTVNEDTSLTITGLSVSDVDAGAASIRTTLSVLHGTLTVAAASGATVTGSGTNTVTLNGSQAQINATLAALNNVVYKGVADFNGSDTLTVATNDNGNAGTGGTLTDTDTVAITVTPVADAPIVTAKLFAPQVSYAVGPHPYFVAIGDFNGDGKPDLVTTNLNSDNVSVLIGNGDGTFQTQVTYSTGTNSAPRAVTIGDFNGDGKSDLAVSDYDINSATDSISVLLGNGNGTFQPAAITAGLTVNSSIATGDFNGDGKSDLVITSPNSNVVSVYLGNGNGTFQARTDFATAVASGAVTIADINGDGKLDLAMASYNSSAVAVMLGNGNGTFQPQTTYAVGSGPDDVAIGDVNGDGKLDLVVESQNSADVSVFLGNGDGTFQSRTSYAAGGVFPWSVAISDVNGDGKVDLVLANSGSSTVSVLLGNGNGTFQPAAISAAGANAIHAEVADLNGDGRMDVVVSNDFGNSVSVLLGNSEPVRATEDTAATIGMLSVAPASVDTGDLLSVNLSVLHGTLSLASTTGLTITSNGSSGTLTFSGSQSDINAALTGLSYLPASNYNGSDTLTISTTATDPTNGSTATSVGQTVPITVAAVNDAPVNTVPGALTVAEDAILPITGLSVSDVDAGNASITTTLSVAHGALIVASMGGAAVSGSGTATVTLTGSVSQINTTLAASSSVKVYVGTPNYNGSDTLTITTSDGGNTGTGGVKTDVDTVAIAVTAVNDAPVNFVPVAQTVAEDVGLSITGLSVSDLDAGSASITTTLSVLHGTMTVMSAGGATVGGSGTATVTLTGSQSQINATLAAANNVVYQGVQNFNGSDTLTVTTNDGGNTGSGGAKPTPIRWRSR